MEFVKNVKCEDDVLKFDFIGTVRNANVLRKIFLSEIPVLALDTINIYENTTVLNYEELCRRLWLIPILHVDPNNMKFVEEKLVFDLEIEKKSGNVLSQDFRLVDANTFKPHCVSTNGSDNNNYDTKLCLFPDIIITPISEEHTLEIRAIAKIGYGRDHAKWNTVSFSKFSEKKGKGQVRFELRSLGQYTPKELLDCALNIFVKKQQEIVVQDVEDLDYLDEE